MAYTPDNSRLMKNTVLLYCRMALMMCINLYTSRIVLHTLGIEDYGIFNVVGGVIIILGFMNDSMTASTQRFLSFELGTGNKGRLHDIFITSLHIHLIIAIIIIAIGETIGLWFVVKEMVIPPERMTAALWCYQFSLFIAILDVLSYPYISAIIAHEKMSSFAYIAILDAILKLLLVYLLLMFDYDRLILYAALYAGEKLLIRMVYNIYCVSHFEECKYRWIFKKEIFVEMASFAGWKMWSNLAYVFYTQGLNVLLNLFFGPAVNAARAAAVQAQGAVSNLASNFQLAINPQITKTYASRQLKRTHLLIYKSSRLTFCLLLTVCLPLIVETPQILSLWLKEVPNGSVIFLRILLVILMVQQYYSPLATAVAATGRIKKYEMIVSGLMLTVMPVSYFVLKMGGAPWSVFIAYLCIVTLAYIANLFIVLPMLKLRFIKYIIYAVKPCATVLFLSLLVPLGMKILATPCLTTSLLNILLTVISTATLSYIFGLDTEERLLISRKVKEITRFCVKHIKK